MALFTKKTEEPQLNIDTASKILENVFIKNQVEPNSVPLEVLTAYSNYRRERFSTQRTILVIIMVLFLILPFCFIPASFSIDSETDAHTANPTFDLHVETKMPVRRITATVNGRNIPVYEVGTHRYSIEPTENGMMTVTVTLMNNQQETKSIEVSNVDVEAPVVVSNEVDSEYVYLYLSDSGSGINYEGIQAVSLDGTVFKPSFYNETTGCVAFAYPSESLNVFVPDYADNSLQLILTIR